MKKHFQFFIEGWSILSMVCFPVLVMSTPTPGSLPVLILAFVLGYAIGWAMEYVNNKINDDREDI